MKKKVAVIIPCYRAKDTILEVVSSLPGWIDSIIVVDDACPESSSEVLISSGLSPKVHVYKNTINLGVGGATKRGFQIAVELGADILIKMDSDGQMDPLQMINLIAPLLEGDADYVKGNRFLHLNQIGQMPFVRRFGNLSLTVLVKFASGMWHVSDPTNGYIAITSKVFNILNHQKIASRYYFESSLMVELNIVGAVVVEIFMPARYNNAQSSLSIAKCLVTFPAKLVKSFIGRLFQKYFLRQPNAVTLFLILGSLLFLFGFVVGASHWIHSISIGRTASAGTVQLAALPVILGTQFLLQALILDIIDRPSSPLTKYLY